MKFLVFNILVTGALAYLIIAGQSDSDTGVNGFAERMGASAHSVKEKVVEAAETAKGAYEDAGVRREAGPVETPAQTPGQMAAKPSASSSPDMKATGPSEPAVAAGEKNAENTENTKNTESAVAPTGASTATNTIEPLKPEPPQSASAPQVAARPSSSEPVDLMPESRTKSTGKTTGTPPLSPAQTATTALSHDAGAKTGGVKIKEGEQLMSPRDRQRELENLAEEMEMMFVRTVGE